MRGTFNAWGGDGDLVMQAQEDGSFQAEVDLAPGQHLYKFVINDTWVGDMCNDMTWGHPEHDYWVDIDADGCETDAQGTGADAYVIIAEEAAE